MQNWCRWDSVDLSDSLEFGHFIFALPDLPRDVGQQCHFVDQQTTYATLLSFQMVPQDSVIVCHQEEKQFRSSENYEVRSPINVGEWNLSSFGSNRIPNVMTAGKTKETEPISSPNFGKRWEKLPERYVKVFWKVLLDDELVVRRIRVGGSTEVVLVFIGKDKSFSTPRTTTFLVAFQSFLRLKSFARLTAMERRESFSSNELDPPWRQKLGELGL